jgi:hypothetical protein
VFFVRRRRIFVQLCYFGPGPLSVVVNPAPAMTDKIEVVLMDVSFGPLLSAAGNEQASIARESVVSAEHVAIGRRNCSGNDRMILYVVDPCLFEPVAAGRLLLIVPVFVSTEKHNFALIAVGYEGCVYSKNL